MLAKNSRNIKYNSQLEINKIENIINIRTNKTIP